MGFWIQRNAKGLDLKALIFCEMKHSVLRFIVIT